MMRGRGSGGACEYMYASEPKSLWVWCTAEAPGPGTQPYQCKRSCSTSIVQWARLRLAAPNALGSTAPHWWGQPSLASATHEPGRQRQAANRGAQQRDFRRIPACPGHLSNSQRTPITTIPTEHRTDSNRHRLPHQWSHRSLGWPTSRCHAPLPWHASAPPSPAGTVAGTPSSQLKSHSHRNHCARAARSCLSHLVSEWLALDASCEAAIACLQLSCEQAVRPEHLLDGLGQKV
eukprot:scaffold2045_cov404-Prasinococcus_capsulatus_cf.AAC.38